MVRSAGPFLGEMLTSERMVHVRKPCRTSPKPGPQACLRRGRLGAGEAAGSHSIIRPREHMVGVNMVLALKPSKLNELC